MDAHWKKLEELQEDPKYDGPIDMTQTEVELQLTRRVLQTLEMLVLYGYSSVRNLRHDDSERSALNPVTDEDMKDLQNVACLALGGVWGSANVLYPPNISGVRQLCEKDSQQFYGLHHPKAGTVAHRLLPRRCAHIASLSLGT